MTESRDSTTNIDERTGLVTLDEAACEALLESTPIGRVVFVDDEGQPLALPVNYRWHDASVVFRTLEGQKLHAALLNQRVSFEVDKWDPDAHVGASVLVKGKANTVEHWAEREQLEQLGLVPWGHKRWRSVWIRITPIEISGRRVA